MAINAHKIRLNPTPAHEAYFWRAAGTRRFVFNWALASTDVSLGRSRKLLESKVPAQGGTPVKVGRFYPSRQLCQARGTHMADLTLVDRVFRCPSTE
jgi:hypothetical protein